MSQISGKVVVAQSGGPTAVINQSMVGAVLESRKFSQISKVYGALNGVEGIVNEKFLDLTQATTHNLEMVANTPSSALLSSRKKPDTKYCQEIFKVLKAHDVRYFFYIGGNDSAETARIVNEEAFKASYELRVIHIPKTIDNDLKVTDHCPGYGSAAKFVSQAFSGVNLDNRSLPGVYIGVVMGRHAGFLTASSVIGKKYNDDGPHLIYLPETDFNIDTFVKDVVATYDKYGRCIVAVAEGVTDKEGTPIMVKLTNSKERDAHGNVQLSGSGALGDELANLIKNKVSKIKRVRADTFGYLQRSFLGVVSEVDQQEAREVGEKAAQFAVWDNRSGSVTIERTGDYSVDYKLTELKNVARDATCMPPEFIKGKNNVTEEFKNYVRPLIGDSASYARIYAPSVDKLL
ncbi:MAG TPA: 6-phosphofructokinase [Spirochaetota bacterium]|nr:6-phosphofructokinase [Spirochaetota bacterium]